MIERTFAIGDQVKLTDQFARTLARGQRAHRVSTDASGAASSAVATPPPSGFAGQEESTMTPCPSAPSKSSVITSQTDNRRDACPTRSRKNGCRKGPPLAFAIADIFPTRPGQFVPVIRRAASGRIQSAPAIWPYCHIASARPAAHKSQNTTSQLNGGFRIDCTEPVQRHLVCLPLWLNR